MVAVRDKKFQLLISPEKLQERIAVLGRQMNEEYKGKRPLFIVVLNGAFLFAGDLLKQIDIDCEITFTRFASYAGTSSTGKVNMLMQLADNIKGKDIIIVEDIVDTGQTLYKFIPHLKLEKPASIKIASLLVKPKAIIKPVTIDYAGFEIENEFVVGYGLDYDGLGRNLNGIYQLSE